MALSDGRVFAAGRGDLGALGTGLKESSTTPVEVRIDATTPLTNGVDVAANGPLISGFSLAATGSLAYAWGNNQFGQLGRGTVSNLATPGLFAQPVRTSGSNSLADVISVAAGYDFSLFLTASGSVYSCGSDSAGQLGRGLATFGENSPYAGQVWGGKSGTTYLTDIIAIAAQDDAGFALKSDGSVWAWGNGMVYGLGGASYVMNTSPIRVRGPKGVGDLEVLTPIVGTNKHLVAGNSHALAILPDNTFVAWGDNTWGQLGINSTSPAHYPLQSECIHNGDGTSE